MTRAAFLRLAEKLGATVHDTDHMLSVEAPAGKVWSAYPVHELVVHLYGWRMAEAYAHLSDDMRPGTEPCTNTECDWCSDL